MNLFYIWILLFAYMPLSAKIYDCFTFFNELDLLKIRFEELYDSVDHFVIVESPISFTGKEKPLYFAENEKAFEKYKDKIIYLRIDQFPGLTGHAENDHWAREAYSRNKLMEGLNKCSDHDIIFISDVDEIPRSTAVSEIKDYFSNLFKLPHKHKKKISDLRWVCGLEMRLFMYQMNRENFAGWSGGSKAVPYFILKKYNPWGIKLFHHKHKFNKIMNAGWHFNTMGGKTKALYKWLLTGPLYSNEEALKELGRNPDLLQQSYQGQVDSNTVPVPIDNSFPKYLLDNLEYFKAIGWIAE